MHTLRQAFAGQAAAPQQAVPASWHPDEELEEELAPKQPMPAKARHLLQHCRIPLAPKGYIAYIASLRAGLAYVKNERMPCHWLMISAADADVRCTRKLEHCFR